MTGNDPRPPVSTGIEAGQADRRTLSSPAKLILLLREIAGSRHQFTLGDMAERTQLTATSTHRLLQELLQAGLVERASGRRYKVGRELYRVASQIVAKFDLNRGARPLIEELGAKWRETAVVCAYSPPALHAVILDVVHSPHPLRFAVERGGIVTLPWGSLGRSILAFLSAGEVEAVLRRDRLSPLNKTPQPPRGELLKELELIRESGFSRHYDAQIGIAGIASPVFGDDGEVFGCVGVTMPANRFDRISAAELAANVCDAARRLTQAMTTAHV